MSKACTYSVVGGLTLVAVGLLSGDPTVTENKVVGALFELGSVEDDSVSVTLVSDEGERMEVDVRRDTIDPFLWEAAATMERGRGEKRVRAIVDGHPHADIVRIERRDTESRIVQVDGVNVRYVDATEGVIRQDGRGGGDSLEVVVEVEACRPLALTVVRGFRGIGVPALMNALRHAADGRAFAPDREFRVEVRSVVERRMPVLECGPNLPETDAGSHEVIFFEFDSADITAKERTKLHGFATGLPRCASIVRVCIEGHTCGIGPPSYNRGLGMRRAEAVHEALVAAGLESCAFNTVSHGEGESRSGGLAEDRRVRIVVYREEQ